MKKTLLFLLLISFAAILTCFSFTAAAEEDDKQQGLTEEEVYDELQNNVNDGMDAIDFTELEEWAKEYGTDKTFSQGVKELVQSVLDGEFSLGAEQFTSIILNAVTGGIKTCVPAFAAIFAIAVMTSMMQGLSSGFLRNNTREIVHFACYAAIIVILSVQITAIIVRVEQTIEGMCSLMQAVFPILLTLITALGSASAAGVYSPLMAILSTGIGTIISSLVLPCFVAAVVLGIVGNMSSNIKLGRLTKFFKSVAVFVLAGAFSLFAAFLTMQGLAGGIADSISIKTAKFAVQSYIPILGGYLSDGLDLALTGIILIKNSLGLVSVIMLFAAVAVPIVQTAVFTLGLKLTAGLCEPICSDKRISDLLYGVSKNTSLLTAALAGMAFMFVILVMLIIGTCNAGVI